MTLLEFVKDEPWWTLVYLIVICTTAMIIVAEIAGSVRRK
jgi:hypothetical protein